MLYVICYNCVLQSALAEAAATAANAAARSAAASLHHASVSSKRPRRQSSSDGLAAAASSGRAGTASRVVLDAKRNVTIDHSVMEDVCRNTYSSDVLKVIVAKRQTLSSTSSGGGGGGGTGLGGMNPSVLKEQIGKQRFRVEQLSPDAKVLLHSNIYILTFTYHTCKHAT